MGEIMRQLNKKADAIPIAIFLVVISTLFLTTFTMFTFSTRSEKILTGINDMKMINEINSKEFLVNFYLQEIVKKSAKNSKSKEEFISNFNSNLNLYKDSEGNYIFEELKQFENKLIRDMIVYENDKFEVELNIKLAENIYDVNNKKSAYAARSYAKKFFA